MSKVSIIVPVYNVAEDYLRACIESCQNQTLKDIEIILVDDGSKDQSGKICDSYAAEDSRINVIHKENGGLAAARNSGAEAATGEWMMYVDGDDWIESSMCETMYNSGVKEGVELVFCGMSKDYANTSEPYKYRLKDGQKFGVKGCRKLRVKVLDFNYNIATAYCKLIKTEAVKRGNIYHDGELRQGAEGIEFNLRLFGNINSAVFIDKPFYHYIYNDSSISASHNEKNHQMVVNCFRKMKTYIDTIPENEELIWWFNNRLLYVIITTAISGYFSPLNREKFSIKKRKYKDYLKNDIINKALTANCSKGLSKSRKLTLMLIRMKAFLIIDMMGKIRYKQKQSK